MNAINFTPLNNMNQIEAIIEKKEYRANFNYSLLPIVIERTNNAIIIRSSYYQLKLSSQDLSQLTGLIFNSIQEVFFFITNTFDNNNYYIKEKTNSKFNIIIRIYDNIRGMPKDIELCLEENFEDKNYLIKELFNKCNNLENEIIPLKNNNYLLNEENKKLKEENMKIKNELQLYQNNTMNSIMNALNSINEIKMDVNQIKQNNNINFMNNQQMMPIPLFNNNIIKEKNDIQVIFHYGFNHLGLEVNFKPIVLDCKPNDLVSDVINQFLKKSVFEINEKEYKFIFNAKNLKKDLTLLEAGISNGSNIFVVKKYPIKI